MRVECPTASRLFQAYVHSAVSCARATDKFADLVDTHEEFAQELQKIMILREECEVFRSEIEHHRREHHCHRWRAEGVSNERLNRAERDAAHACEQQSKSITWRGEAEFGADDQLVVFRLRRSFLRVGFHDHVNVRAFLQFDLPAAFVVKGVLNPYFLVERVSTFDGNLRLLRDFWMGRFNYFFDSSGLHRFRFSYSHNDIPLP